MTPAEIRRHLGLTQRELADICNTAIGTVRKWESGEQSPSGPSARLLEMLAWLQDRGLLSEALEGLNGKSRFFGTE